MSKEKWRRYLLKNEIWIGLKNEDWVSLSGMSLTVGGISLETKYRLKLCFSAILEKTGILLLPAIMLSGFVDFVLGYYTVRASMFLVTQKNLELDWVSWNMLWTSEWICSMLLLLKLWITFLDCSWQLWCPVNFKSWAINIYKCWMSIKGLISLLIDI